MRSLDPPGPLALDMIQGDGAPRDSA